MEDIEVSGVLPGSPERIYMAWLDGDQHAVMTGGGASSDPVVGGAFTAWDGYIQGQHLLLIPPGRIVQNWRTSEFPPDAPDSRLEIRFEPHPQGTAITLKHTGLPDGQGAQYKSGWVAHYLEPMGAHFRG